MGKAETGQEVFERTGKCQACHSLTVGVPCSCLEHKLKARIRELEGQVAELKAGLRFYADPQNYGLHGGSVNRIIEDAGRKAKNLISQD